jgi:hypothetical protein
VADETVLNKLMKKSKKPPYKKNYKDTVYGEKGVM